MERCFTRRTLLKGLAGAALGIEGVWRISRSAYGLGLPSADLVWSTLGFEPKPEAGKAAVALVKGGSRKENISEALRLIQDDVKRSIGNKRVVIKPNMVTTQRQLAATHVDALAATLEFLKPIYNGKILVAESPAMGSADEGFENYGYKKLTAEYGLEFKDLNSDESESMFILDYNLRPLEIKLAKTLLAPDIYLVSLAVPKTHDTVVTTQSLKNVVMSAPLREGSSNYKRRVHQGFKEINFNIFQIAQRIKPDLAILDGFEAMQGMGPIGGDPVELKTAVASTDFLAADRISAETMGINFDDIGYLKFCALAEMGRSSMDNIEVKGEKVENCVQKFQLAPNIDAQLSWKVENPPPMKGPQGRRPQQ